MTPDEFITAIAVAHPDQAPQVFAAHSALIKEQAATICDLQLARITTDPFPSPSLVLTLPMMVAAAVAGNEGAEGQERVQRAVAVLTAIDPSLRRMVVRETLSLVLPDSDDEDTILLQLRRVLAEQMVAVARTLADEATSAQPELVAALFVYGRTLEELEQYEAAVPPLREAVGLGRKLAAKDAAYRPVVGDVLLWLAGTFNFLGRQSEMVRAFEEAETFGKPNPFVLTGKQPPWPLWFRMYLGREEASYLDRAIEAARTLDRSVAALLESYRHGDVDAISRQAVALMERLKQEGRLDEYQTVHLLVASLPVEQLRHLDTYDGTEFTRLLDLQLEACNRAIGISQRLHDVPCLGKYLFYRGAVLAHRQELFLQERGSAAEQDVAEAFRLYTELAEWDPAYRPALVNIGGNLALLRFDPDRTDAERLLEQAISLCRDVAAEDAGSWFALSGLLTNLAYVLGQRDAFAEALVSLDEAYALYRAHGREDPLFASAILTTLLDLSTLLRVLGRDEEALRRAREAVEIYRRLAVGQRISRPIVGTNLLCAYGDLLLDAGDLRGARAAFAEAIDLTERYLIALPDTASQVRLLRRPLNPYESMVATCLRLASESGDGDTRRQYEEEAWSYAERSRARLTAEFVHRIALASAGGHRGDERSALLVELADQRRQLLAIAHVIDRNVTRASAAALSGLPAATRAYLTAHALRAEMSAAFTDRIHALRTQLEQIDPTLAALERVTMPDLRAIQRTLRAVPDGALVLELYPLPSSNRLAVFILDEQHLRVEVIDCHWEQLTAYTDRFRAVLRRSSGVSDPRFDQDLTDALAWLGAKLRPLLEQLAPARAVGGHHAPHLLLVPAGPLHHWPLWALPVFSDGERLLDRWACSVLPSADSLVSLGVGEHNPAPPTPLSAFAPPTRPLLPFAEATARFSAAALGGVTYTGTRATFAQLQQVDGGVVVLSTHAHVMLDVPELSWVQLTKADGREDRVSAFEFLIGLDRLRSPLITLLACEIHAAQPEATDNWVGLSRAFLRTGRCLIASLWSIDDAATLALTVPFWDEIRKGMTVPQALRCAMRTLRQVDSVQLQDWTPSLAAALPEADRETLRDAWTDQVRPGATNLPVTPFAGVAVWAPYLAIGWPGTLR